MIFDAGLFYSLLGIAFIVFFIKVPYRETLMFVSCVIFILLGTVLYSDVDVVFNSSSSVSDGLTTISGNHTAYIFGDSSDSYNQSSKILATFLIIIGIITGLISFVMLTNTNPERK